MELRPFRLFVLASLVALIGLNTGCVSQAIATAFTNPPNGGNDAIDSDRPLLPIHDGLGQVNAPGPPPVELAYWVMEPGPARIIRVADGAEPPPVSAERGWRSVDAKTRKGKGFVRTERGPVDPTFTPRATVVVLHGWASQGRSSDTLWHLSATLADAGCRVILPDLRGHGDSTGEYVTSGFREVEDLSILLDHVEHTYGGANAPVGVAGHSYGGGIAIQFAAHDERVERVLALAPLADIRPAMLPGVRAFARQARPISWFFYLNWAVNQDAIDEAQQLMEQRTGADLATHNALYQITRVDVPILILQGAKDPATPLAGAERLRDANPDVVELVVYPNGEHTSFLRDDFNDIEIKLRDWVAGLTSESRTPQAQTKSVSRK